MKKVIIMQEKTKQDIAEQDKEMKQLTTKQSKGKVYNTK